MVLSTVLRLVCNVFLSPEAFMVLVFIVIIIIIIIIIIIVTFNT